MSISLGTKQFVQFTINATDTAAGTAQERIAPIDGYITDLDVIVQEAIVTGGAVTVEINGTAVAGLSVTVANSATKGTRYTDTATKGSATRAVSKGDRITITPAAAFNGGGAISGYVTIASSVAGEAAL